MKVMAPVVMVLGFSGCGGDKELKKYNEQNKHVYQDFAKFVEQKGENGRLSLYYGECPEEHCTAVVDDYGIYLSFSKLDIKDSKVISMRMYGGINDNDGDGLYSNLFTNDKFFEEEITTSPSKKNLNGAKFYTEVLNQIMKGEWNIEK